MDLHKINSKNMNVIVEIEADKVSLLKEILSNYDFIKGVKLETSLEDTLSPEKKEIWEGIKRGFEDIKTNKVLTEEEFFRLV
jgi:hypothetical protein